MNTKSDDDNNGEYSTTNGRNAPVETSPRANDSDHTEGTKKGDDMLMESTSSDGKFET